MKKILFVILDGAGDGLKKDTSLELAHKPNLDAFSQNGFSGLIENKSGKHPDSGVSIWQLFGYNLDRYPGRGFLDALGVGLKPMPHTLYMRANFATAEKKTMKTAQGQFAPKYIVKDRRAGRDPTGLKEIATSIAEMHVEGFNVKFHKSVAHRGILTISNYNVSPNVTDTDSGRIGDVVDQIEATTKDDKAAQTAAVLNKWIDKVVKLLEEHPVNKTREFPANMILLRGASVYSIDKTFKEEHGMTGAVIAASPVVKGMARHFEMDAPYINGATADQHTDMNAKVLAALDALNNHDFVVLHILAPDIMGHDKIVRKKSGIIEKIDKEVFGKIKEYVDFNKTVLCVTSDHITSIFTGDHEAGKFPFCIYTADIESNKLEGYYEIACRKGPVIDISEWFEMIMQYR